MEGFRPIAIDVLPDDLLGRILALVRPEELKPAAAVVSRRWNRVYWTDQHVWRCLSLFPSSLEDMLTSDGGYYGQMRPDEKKLDKWLPAKKLLVARVAPAVRHLRVQEPGYAEGAERWMEALALRALRLCSGQLEELELEWPTCKFTEQATHALQAVSGITRLELSGNCNQLPPAPLLQHFQRLQALSIEAPATALSSLLPAMQQLHQLTALSLQNVAGYHDAVTPHWMALLTGLLPRLLDLRVRLEYPTAFDVPGLRVLQQAAGLNRLTVEQPYGELQPLAADELAAALCAMPDLAALSIQLNGITPNAVGSITKLTALTSLCLVSCAACLPASVEQLTVLSRLQHLTLTEGAFGPAYWFRPAQQPAPVWPAPRAFHSMQRLRLFASSSFKLAAGNSTLRAANHASGKLGLEYITSCQSLDQLLTAVLLTGCTALSLEGLSAWKEPRLPLPLAGCSQLHGLRQLEVKELKAVSLDAAVLPALESTTVNNCDTVSLGSGGAPPPRLESLTVSRCGTVSIGSNGAPPQSLEHLAVSSCGTLSLGPAPLPALRFLALGCDSASLDPAVLPQLQSLSVRGNDRSQQISITASGSAVLPSLRSLHWNTSGSGMAALLQEVMQRAPQLSDLEIHLPNSSKDPGIADSYVQVLAAACNPLTKLNLTGLGCSNLRDFPPCHCLSTLEELTLSISMTCLPAALATATRLRHLDLRGPTLEDLEITFTDVEHILSPMQQLTKLDLHSWSKSLSPPAAAQLFRRLPLLCPPSQWARW